MLSGKENFLSAIGGGRECSNKLSLISTTATTSSSSSSKNAKYMNDNKKSYMIDNKLLIVSPTEHRSFH